MGRSSLAGPSRQKLPPPPPAVSGFNPGRTHFALALPVLGSAEKVQVWDVPADAVVSEWELPGASKAAAVCWACVAASGATKKRRRRKSTQAAQSGDAEEDVLLVATSKDDQSNLIVYSPIKGEALRTLSLPAKATAMWSDDNGVIIATESNLLVLGPDVSSIAHTFDLPSAVKSPTAVAFLPTSTSDLLHVIVASMSVVALHLSTTSTSVSHTSSPLPVSTTSVTALQPLPLTQQGSSFLVVSEDDRTVSQYTFATPTATPKLSFRYASPTLSPVHSLALSAEFLAALHYDGDVSVFPIPSELDFTRPKSDNKPSKVKLVEGKEQKTATLCRVAFAPVDEGAPAVLSCGRLVGGSRVKWYSATVEQPEGGLIANVVVKTDAQDLVSKDAPKGANNLQRYKAPANAVQAADEDKTESAAALPTDVDMADLSLGERLLAAPTEANGDAAAADGPVNAASLTRILVQALHTADPALLTLCLSHRDPVLIRNTIRKLPAQLSLPLLKACVERLGQGKGANRRGGGRGGMQNEQQGRGTVEWVKGVLIERGNMLMTLPSLPAQLAQLSNLLATRMELYQPLLALSGRLDLALAQIKVRRQAAENANVTDKGEGEHYVEGESDDEVQVEVGDEDDEDAIEDINMMAGSSDEEEDSEDEEDDDEGDSEDPLDSDDGGFLDIEAEESDDDDEDEDEDDEE